MIRGSKILIKTISRPQNCGAVLGHTCNRIDREPNSPLRAGAYWSVYELTHRAPGSRRAAGSRSTRTESPRICWHTIFICGKPQWYGKPLKQLGLLSRQAHIRRVTGRIAAIGVASRASNEARWLPCGGSRTRPCGKRAVKRSNGKPPNLLADYLYLWETTVVRQAIETARVSVSSGGHSSSYWSQQRLNWRHQATLRPIRGR